MYTFDYQRTVAGRSPQDCFDVVTNPDLGDKWVSMANDVRAEGPAGEGRKIISKAGLVGINFEVEAVVDAWDEPNEYGWKGDKPFYSKFHFVFTEEGDGTRIDANVEFDPGKFFKFGTGKVAAKTFGKQFEGDLDRLVKLIQTS